MFLLPCLFGLLFANDFACCFVFGLLFEPQLNLVFLESFSDIKSLCVKMMHSRAIGTTAYSTTRDESTLTYADNGI